MANELRLEVGSTVVPGDRLGLIQKAGPGTHVRGGHAYAAVHGSLQQSDHGVVTVQPTKPLLLRHVLRVGQVVLAKVLRLTLQQAIVEIVATPNGVLPHSYEGAIAKEDIHDEAPVAVHQAFAPSDVVICRVLSLGDSRRYFLTTAEASLGVLHAKSKSGHAMVPTSWKEMECPETGAKERRKCARPAGMS